MRKNNYYYWKRKKFSARDVPYNKLYEPIITDSRICMGAKVLFADIANLSKNRRKCCTASNRYFAKRYSVGVDTIKAWLKQLRAANYITSTGRRERKISINMHEVRDRYAYNGDKTTPEEGIPMGVETTLYEKNVEKSPESIDSRDENTKDEDFIWG
jgi:hypothetical protein